MKFRFLEINPNFVVLAPPPNVEVYATRHRITPVRLRVSLTQESETSTRAEVAIQSEGPVTPQGRALAQNLVTRFYENLGVELARQK